jgi:hypothetical protein
MIRKQFKTTLIDMSEAVIEKICPTCRNRWDCKQTEKNTKKGSKANDINKKRFNRNEDYLSWSINYTGKGQRRNQ